MGCVIGIMSLVLWHPISCILMIFFFLMADFFFLKKYLVEINLWRENGTTELVILMQFL